MSSAALDLSPSTGRAGPRQWRSPCRKRLERARGAVCSPRRAGYRIADSFGCDLVVESPEKYASELERRARSFDRDLVELARDDSAGRRVLGRLAARFIELRGYERLGFTRFADYTAERLGWSGRQIQDIARVAAALAQLPLVERAFRRGALSWSKARLLASIASASDETKWLAVAAATDVGALTAATGSARAAAREERRTGCDRQPIDGEESEEEEARVLVRIECSQRAMRMWNEARRYAPRIAGRVLTRWQVAELIAAEASSAPGPYAELWQQEPWRSISATQRRARQWRTGQPRGAGTHAPPHRPDVAIGLTSRSPADGRDDSSANAPGRCGSTPRDESSNGPDEIASPLERELARLEELDAFELDAAMRRVRRAMQQRQWRLGIALGQFLDLRLSAELGYASGTDYVRERLGIGERTARDLVRVAQAAERRSSALAAAYSQGELSWLRVDALLPVVRGWNAAAWIERAGEVTLRRLADEVAWASEHALDPRLYAAMPPTPGQDLRAGDDERRICAHDRHADEVTGSAGDGTNADRDELWGILGRLRVVFVAPASVSALFRTTMQSFASPTEPRWKAFERMLEHVVAQWKSQPRHRDPVFARDGYRCTAPGCSSLANLHDHHIIARSAGGSNDPANRTTLCAWHHLRAVHGGLARATGQAPEAIDWELGLRAATPPLMHLRGDRYCR